jgi:acyl carrier protein
VKKFSIKCLIAQFNYDLNKIFNTGFIYMNEIKARVKRIIANQLEVEEEMLSDDATLFKDLGADSIDTVELVIAFEVEFDIEIPEDQAEKLYSLQDIYSYVNSRIAGK